MSCESRCHLEMYCQLIFAPSGDFHNCMGLNLSYEHKAASQWKVGRSKDNTNIPLKLNQSLSLGRTRLGSCDCFKHQGPQPAQRCKRRAAQSLRGFPATAVRGERRSPVAVHSEGPCVVPLWN